MTGLSDSFQRPINYLRISVTDRCNLRCLYCMPPQGIPQISHQEVLSYEEIELVARAAAELGIAKIRITGGEPLVRLGLIGFVEKLAKIPGIDDLSITTNGILLSQYAAPLKEAGLKRVNISLDTLKADRFRRITRIGRLKDVLRGIEAAQLAGLDPLKINTVVMRGTNDDEILDFARMTLEEGWHVRFIELMPFGEERGAIPQGKSLQFMPISQMEERIQALGKLEPCSPPTGNGPAKYFRLPGARGTIGFITPLSDCFCSQCNRLRLTADGRLRPCLFSDSEVDLRIPMRRGASAEELKGLIREAVTVKPQGHQLAEGITCQRRAMIQIGG